MKSIKGNIVDVITKSVFYGEVTYDNRIKNIIKLDSNIRCGEIFILPGLIDSHVHIESSMLTPQQFSRLIVPHGTIAIVCDPHEIANVLGEAGVQYMIADSNKSPFKFYFAVPSCVPATCFETSGGVLDSKAVENLLSNPSTVALAEMMNYPGVLSCDNEVMLKIDSAKNHNKPIDGHAPQLSGDDLRKYVNAGVSTDHECSSYEEALEKIKLGMFIQIREGSAARNFDSLYKLLFDYSDKVMFCTDDAHPDEISANGHIDKIVRLALSKGVSIFDILNASHLNPIKHYKLDVGSLQKGDNADFITVDSLDTFNILSTQINGETIFDNGELLFTSAKSECVNNFNCSKISEDLVAIVMNDNYPNIKVIDVTDGELLTGSFLWRYKSNQSNVLTSTDEDILKIVVVNRYQSSKPVVGFVRGFGMKRGAFASSIAHDSHNIVAVGVSDVDIANAINMVIDSKGGIAATDGNMNKVLKLPIAGLMTDDNYENVVQSYSDLVTFSHNNCDCKLKSPFMTMAFMSLLVIPSFKISDKGLFDVDKFCFTNLFA